MAEQNNIQSFEIFDDYLNNRMSAAERSSFEEKLSHDNSFASLFEDCKISNVATQIFEINNLRGILNDIDYEEFERKNLRNKNIKIAALLLALCVIVGSILIYKNTNNTTSPKDHDVKYNQSNNLTTVKSTESEKTVSKTEEVSTKAENIQHFEPTQKNVSTIQSTNNQLVDNIQTQHNNSVSNVATTNAKVESKQNVNNSFNQTPVNHNFTISAVVETKNTCAGESTGKININNVKFAGNQISVYVNEKLVYQGNRDNITIPNLSEGKYHLHIIDNKNSAAYNADILIETFNNATCISTIKGIVNIHTNQNWNLDAEAYNRTIIIYGMGGNVLLKNIINANDSFEWNGSDANGNILPLGTYFVEVTDNQNVLKAKGTVSVIGQ